MCNRQARSAEKKRGARRTVPMEGVGRQQMILPCAWRLPAVPPCLANEGLHLR